MGYEVYPVPASSSGFNWVEIATSAPTSGSAVTFSSIPSYAYLRVVGVNLVSPGAAPLNITLNGSTSGYENRNVTLAATAVKTETYGDSKFAIITLGNATTPFHFDITINDTNKPMPKSIDNTSWASATDIIRGIWNGTATVTSLSISLNGTTYSSGNIYLYGSN